MTDRPVLIPGQDHPITMTPSHNRVVVSAAGRTIADTRDAMTLQEASYPPVFYIPLKDVDQTLLADSKHSSYCPYKGEASYYSLPLLGAEGNNAVWQYREPYDAVSEIRDLVAFYPDRVEISEAN